MTSGDGRTLTWTPFNMPLAIAQGASTLTFTYDTEHGRVKQVAPDGTTLYINDTSAGLKTEKFIGASSTRWVNYVYAAGGIAAVVNVDSVSGTTTRYFHKDHLGSTAVITDESGAVVERLAYDAWGKRRNTNGADDPTNSLTSLTTRGFTGHEHLQAVALVHMNGRVYDPLLGRFLSADPFIQDAGNTQSLNRYSYVLNNPLAYTDPNGFFFKSLFKAIGNLFSNLRTIIAIAVIVVTQQYEFLPGVLGLSAATTTAIAGGFVAGGIAGGSLQSAIVGGISAGLFAGVSPAAKAMELGLVGKAALYGAVGGISSAAMGGDFKSGFIAAGFTSLVGPQLGDWGKGLNVVKYALVGGAAAKLAGGKFENGAVTAAFAYAFGQLTSNVVADRNVGITINGTDADKADFAEARRYLSEGVPEAAKLFDRAVREGLTVNIIDDHNDRAYLGRRIVYWDPRSALTTPDMINQSPALGLYHEMVHAFGDPTVPVIAMDGYTNTEEYRVIRDYETPAARALNEGVRDSHGGNPYRVPCSTCR